MLPKKARLTTQAFDRSFAVGKRYHSAFFQIIHESGGSFHASAVVGKKVYKKAVDRNALRRKMYVSIQNYCSNFECTGSYIVIAKQKVTELTQKEIPSQIEDLLKKIKQ